jgi:DNA-binding NarL/FixJ family response regulator
VKQTTVLLADDHVLMTDTLCSMLREHFQIVGVAKDGTQMVEMAKHHKPDVIVSDVTMPNLNGVDALRILHKELPSTKVLFLSMHDDILLIEELFRQGAAGFIRKTDGKEAVLKAIRTVASGHKYITPLVVAGTSSGLKDVFPQAGSNVTLTPRQRELLQSFAEGKTMKEAGDAMQISKRTAEWQKYEIMRKLGIRTTAELIRFAIRINDTNDSSPSAPDKT